MNKIIWTALAGAALWAQPRPLTLQQAVDLALRQNPDLLLARLDEQKARTGVREARAPFVPRLAVGSGLAYSSGFPLSIEGAAPSIVQAQGSQFLYNRPQSMRVKEARELAGAAEHATGARAEEIAFRVAATYLDWDRAVRAAEAAGWQVETLRRVEQLVEERVRAGRELALELTRARLESARARTRQQDLASHAVLLEATLRADLGLGDDSISPVETRAAADASLPESEDTAVQAALVFSKELKRLEGVVRAKGYQIEAEKAAKYPRADLVAQYALLGRFNNYEDFFRTFERHNGQLGLSVQLPLFARGQIGPRIAQAETEAEQAKVRLTAARSTVALEARRLHREVQQAESAGELTRLELDLARESLSVLLARFDEGRAPLREVEQARVLEAQRWEAFYDAQTTAGKARLNLLRHTGGLLAALR
jgi:outer membrane protein TolC